MRTGLVIAAALLGTAVGAPVGEAALVSQGGVRMGADVFWSRGLLGQGQTVAVLDQGFAALDRSIALGELPPREAMTTRAFDPAAGLDGRTEFGQPTQHGVRMAEIIHDVAPDAHLVLASYTTMEQFAQAAAWIAAQGIPVVSHSNSFLTPPFDGTGPAARAVDAAAAGGVLWVNSAGNYATRHWRGVAAPAGTVIPIAPPAGLPMLFSLTWSAGAAAASVALERDDGAGGWVEVRRSLPAGPGNAVLAPVTAEAAAYRLVVRQPSGPPAQLDLFSETVGFGAAAVGPGSIPTPGDAAGALTVGAVKWTGTALEPYSSQGAAGGPKPDLVGPTYVTSNPEWPGTAGTSAATAHVAGAAALLRGSRLAAGLGASAAELRGVLVAGALDLGDPGPDPLFGAGMARLDATAPALRLALGGGSHRLLRVRSGDAGTIREVRVSLNGRVLRVVRRPVVGLRLPALRRGRNTLSVTAEDMAGNLARRTRTLRGPR